MKNIKLYFIVFLLFLQKPYKGQIFIIQRIIGPFIQLKLMPMGDYYKQPENPIRCDPVNWLDAHLGISKLQHKKSEEYKAVWKKNKLLECNNWNITNHALLKKINQFICAFFCECFSCCVYTCDIFCSFARTSSWPLKPPFCLVHKKGVDEGHHRGHTVKIRYIMAGMHRYTLEN